MPRTKIGSRRKYGKRKFAKRTKRRYSRRIRRTNPSSYAGFPKTKFVRLRFSTFKEYDMMTASSAFYNVASDFSCNSITNPEARSVPTSGDNRPIGYDQWAQFYKQYVVHKAVATVSLVTPAPAQVNTGILASLRVTRDYVPGAPPLQIPLVTDVVTQGNCSYSTLNYYTKTKLKRTFVAKDFFNVKDVKDNLNSIGADMLDDPPEQALFYFQLGPIDATAPESGLQKVQALWTIDYYVTFHEPMPLAKSITP